MNKDKKKKKDMDNSLLKYKGEFEAVYSIIAAHRERVVRVVNNESMAMVWEVGGYVSNRLKSSAWGDGVVRQLAEYIHTQDPAARGWSYRTIYKMVQLYDTYSTSSFASLLAETDMKVYKDIVPFETAQIPNVLFCAEKIRGLSDIIVTLKTEDARRQKEEKQ